MATTDLHTDEASRQGASSCVGVFDSGVGGLTVLTALRDAMPTEDFIYFGDTGRTPYGSKPQEMVARFAEEISAFLLSKQVKAIVIACNTASCAALDKLSRTLPVPVFGVIDPAIDAALVHGKRIGVIGTSGTINSEAYQTRLSARGAHVWSKACPLLAPMVEEGLWDDPIAQLVVRHYLEDAPKSLHSLILGCTHYPVLKNVMSRVVPWVNLIDSAESTAEVVRTALHQKGLANTRGTGAIRHFVTGDASSYRLLASRFGVDTSSVTAIDVADLIVLGQQFAATPQQRMPA
ncbi:MAG: glutamate racemase [Proteobacteria bacterium]|nr:glutamate racemase [Pseudomonadota bacterium]